MEKTKSDEFFERILHASVDELPGLRERIRQYYGNFNNVSGNFLQEKHGITKDIEEFLENSELVLDTDY